MSLNNRQAIYTNFQYPFKCDVPSGVVAASMNHVGSYQVLSLLDLLVQNCRADP